MMYTITLNEPLDSGAVQLYLHWVYTRTLVFQEGIDRGTDAFLVHLLQAWTVSDTVQDANFRHALVAELLSPFTDFWPTTIEYAFGDRPSRTMQAFLVDLSLAMFEPEQLEKDLFRFPITFTHAVYGALFKSMKNKPLILDVLRKHTDDSYELVAP